MISDVVQSASEFIREYDPKLADMWLAQPFNRITIAKAFAKGLKPKQGQHDYQMGLTIIDIARQDMQERRIAMIERV